MTEMTDLNLPNQTSVLDLLETKPDLNDPEIENGEATILPSKTHVISFSAETEEFDNARVAMGIRYKDFGISVMFDQVTFDPNRTRGDLAIYRSIKSDAGQKYEPASPADIKFITDDFLCSAQCKNLNDEVLLQAGAEIELDGTAIRFSRTEKTSVQKELSTKQQIHDRIVESRENEVIIQGLLKAINLSSGTLSLNKVIVETLVGNERVHFGNIDNIRLPKCISEIFERVHKKPSHMTLTATHDGSFIEIESNSALDILEELAHCLLSGIAEHRNRPSARRG